MANASLPGDAPDSDLEWHAWPPRPHGGQIAGPTHHGVLVIHKPTGLAAFSTEHRSQLANKANARQLLQAHLDLRPVWREAATERERLRGLLSEACAALEAAGHDAIADRLRRSGGAIDE